MGATCREARRGREGRGWACSRRAGEGLGRGLGRGYESGLGVRVGAQLEAGEGGAGERAAWGGADQLVAITGSPMAMASTCGRPHPSPRLGSTKASAAA